MTGQLWCEHVEKISKYVYVSYDLPEKQMMLRVQTWYCPECGIHGANTEIQKDSNKSA